MTLHVVLGGDEAMPSGGKPALFRFVMSCLLVLVNTDGNDANATTSTIHLQFL
jgi:hypothetical protein